MTRVHGSSWRGAREPRIAVGDAVRRSSTWHHQSIISDNTAGITINVILLLLLQGRDEGVSRLEHCPVHLACCEMASERASERVSER